MAKVWLGLNMDTVGSGQGYTWVIVGSGFGLEMREPLNNNIQSPAQHRMLQNFSFTLPTY